jgi:hypothetical protein
MPQKKPKPQERTPVYIRFSAQELGPSESDRKAMPGIPVTLGAYAKHAVLSYPALRLLEQNVRHYLQHGGEDFPGAAKLTRELLETSGLEIRR